MLPFHPDLCRTCSSTCPVVLRCIHLLLHRSRSEMYFNYHVYRQRTQYDGRLYFHRCLSVNMGSGLPQPLLPKVPSQHLVPGPFWGRGYPSSVTGPAGRGTPVLAKGVPHDMPPRQDWVSPARTWVPTVSTGVPPHPGLGYPWAGLGYPQDRLCCGRYASCGFPKEDFLVTFCCYQIKKELFDCV